MSAIFSSNRVYRYVLTRDVAGMTGHGAVAFICLNASKADETHDDQTVRRMMGFARRWGYSHLHVLNLFALVTKDPVRLRTHSCPVGPENDVMLRLYTEQAALTVAAWGNWGSTHGRDKAVARMLPGPLWCLGLNKGGQPVHPLYQPADAQLKPFEMKS